MASCIAFSDKDGKVYTLTVADKKLVEIADSKRGQVQDYTWSPKGNYLAFTMTDDNNDLIGLCLVVERQPVAPRHQQHVQRIEPGVGPAGQLSFLPEHARICAAHLRRRIQLRVEQRHGHLRHRVAQGRQASIPGGKRRSDYYERGSAKTPPKKARRRQTLKKARRSQKRPSHLPT